MIAASVDVGVDDVETFFAKKPLRPNGDLNGDQSDTVAHAAYQGRLPSRHGMGSLDAVVWSGADRGIGSSNVQRETRGRTDGVGGCLTWQRLGKLDPPPEVVEATKEYFEAEDALGRWLEERCVRDPNGKTLTSESLGPWFESKRAQSKSAKPTHTLLECRESQVEQ